MFEVVGKSQNENIFIVRIADHKDPLGWIGLCINLDSGDISPPLYIQIFYKFTAWWDEYDPSKPQTSYIPADPKILEELKTRAETHLKKINWNEKKFRKENPQRLEGEEYRVTSTTMAVKKVKTSSNQN